MDDLTQAFNWAYYESRVWEQTTWLGVPTLKAPTDLWMYQEILHEVRPDFVVECGTYRGGSALFLASICELLGHGHVLTIDLAPAGELPQHPRITYITGSSTEAGVVARVRETVGNGSSCLVILDSDHSRDHVLAELRAYAPLVGVGSYLIVEDTNINGHPVLPDFGPGPMEAVEVFLRESEAFAPDRDRERYRLTFNPSGYLRRVH